MASVCISFHKSHCCWHSAHTQSRAAYRIMVNIWGRHVNRQSQKSWQRSQPVVLMWLLAPRGGANSPCRWQVFVSSCSSLSPLLPPVFCHKSLLILIYNSVLSPSVNLNAQASQTLKHDFWLCEMRTHLKSALTVITIQSPASLAGGCGACVRVNVLTQCGFLA